MVNAYSDEARAAERALALGYAPADARPALTVLFALDERLRAITLAARDRTIGLMRLTWWREALERLDTAPAPAEPLLRGIAADLLTRGVNGAALSELTETWELVLEGDVDWTAVARARARLFGLGSALLGASDPRVEPVAIAWSLLDLARDWSDAARPEAAALDGAFRRQWPAALRPLGALGLIARFDLAGRTRPGSPRRVARLLWHRLTGR